jgi:hypothetical protein
MRESYLPPELTRVASVEDLTLANGASNAIDVCITVGPGVTVGVAVPGLMCS